MKKLFAFLLLATSVWALQAQAAKAPAKTVKLVCKITGAPANAQQIFLYDQVGLAYVEVAHGNRLTDDTYEMVVPAGKPRLYSIGFSQTMNGRIILGEEPELTLYANAQFMEKGRTLGSVGNKGLEKMRSRVESLRERGTLLQQEYRIARSARNAGDLKSNSAALVALGTEKRHYLDSLKRTNTMLWRSATLQLSPDYHSGLEGYQDELDFYAKEFFGYADLQDKAYEEVPDVLDAFQNYVMQISQLGASTTASKQMFEAQLAKLTPGTNTHRRALSGIVNGLKASGHPDYAVFARKYIDTYKNDDRGEIAPLQFSLKQTSTSTPGMEAPDLEGGTPDGATYALSKLRGKVVLVDFWASWCGPCRRENPNVVAMYNKYKDKGFDILGVSLDREAGAWQRAIEQDGLIWHHISDLKGWSSEHAKLYSVSSIPQTVLLDRDGKIIQRNLRGEQLGEKLKEIFGE